MRGDPLIQILNLEIDTPDGSLGYSMKVAVGETGERRIVGIERVVCARGVQSHSAVRRSRPQNENARTANVRGDTLRLLRVGIA